MRDILACCKSGQMSEAQWQQHLEDELFSTWINRGPKHESPIQKNIQAVENIDHSHRPD